MILTENLKQIIPGVFIIPPVLSTSHIEKILATCGAKHFHHDDGGGHHMMPVKPHNISWFSDLIWENISDIQLDGFNPLSVDPNIKLYRLVEGAGEVSQHKDMDFEGPNNSIAKFSILIYLNDDFSGGETVFNGNIYAPHSPAGGGLLFRHDILHEGLIVTHNEKIVLKTDLFVI